jgi:hypothetical protein
MIFSKKMLFFSCLLMSSMMFAYRTRGLQLIVLPEDPSYIFALNDGTGITHNPGGFRPFGSYYVTNALIFPEGTVNKDQESYLVDKNDNEIIEADSLGMAYFMETMLHDIDVQNMPASGIPSELSVLHLNFKHKCYGVQNRLYALGSAITGTMAPQTAAFEFVFGVVGGAGCNENVHGTSFSAKVYVAPDGRSAIIELSFEEDIRYE